jgi:hypothetical protein
MQMGTGGLMSTCVHHWAMTGIRSGYLVIEGCYHCGARGCFFSDEPAAPMDEYREGKHMWRYLSGYQAVKFSLRCDECGRTVDLDDMMGLMLSTCQDPACQIGRLAGELGKGTSIYVALCADSSHASGRCVSDEGIAALNEYFNQRLRSAKKKIVVVPCSMCSDIDCCPGVVIADAGLTEL